jgi:hypothetical protein
MGQFYLLKYLSSLCKKILFIVLLWLCHIIDFIILYFCSVPAEQVLCSGCIPLGSFPWPRWLTVGLSCDCDLGPETGDGSFFVMVKYYKYIYDLRHFYLVCCLG